MPASTAVGLTAFPLYLGGIVLPVAANQASGSFTVSYGSGDGTGTSTDTVSGGPIVIKDGLGVATIATFNTLTASTVNGTTTVTGDNGINSFTIVYTGNNPATAKTTFFLDTPLGPQQLTTGTGTVAHQYTPCFVRGTHIVTPSGDRPVEDLRIGDLVVTSTGESRPILWIGTRSYGREFAATNTMVCPIRFAKDALGDNLPKRDLLVSPCHAVLIDDMLIPAGMLVNGISITQRSIEGQVDYFHIELDEHDVVIAEGVPSETFIDDHGRLMFHNADEYFTLYPHRDDADAVYAHARVEDGEELESVRVRLSARAMELYPLTQAA